MTRNRTDAQKAIAKAKHEKRQAKYSNQERHDERKDIKKLLKLTRAELARRFKQNGLDVSKTVLKAFWDK